MASSCSNPHVTLEVREEEEYPCTYPYPSNLSAASFVSVKLSGRDKYGLWKAQMECLLESHGMSGFINGTFVSPKTSSSVSGKEKEGDHHTTHNYSLWRRSDALVKGWIFGSLSDETLGYVLNHLTRKEPQQQTTADFSAKDVWEELQTIYGPVVLQPLPVSDEQQEWARKRKQILYQGVISGDWGYVDRILSTGKVTVIDKITNNGNTALHVAVGTNQKPEFLEKLLQHVTPDPENSTQPLLNLKNSDGSTPLHVAAIIGNTEAAKILMERCPELLLAKDKEDHTPLALALSNMHKQTSQFLLQQVRTDKEKDTLFSGKNGDDLVVIAISSEDFGLASTLVLLCNNGVFVSDAVLMAIAQNLPCEPNILEKYIYSFVEEESSCGCGSWVYMLCRFIAALPFIKERVRIRKDAFRLLRHACLEIRAWKDPGTHHHYYKNPIFEATRQNAYEFIECIATWFPNAIWSVNEDGHNFVQYAVINR